MDRRCLAALALLASLTAAVFLPVVDYPFISLDDDVYVYDNPMVRRGIGTDTVRWAFTSVGYAGNWHPLTWLSHQLDVRLFGMDAGRHHLVSLLLHLFNALLLFLVLSNSTGTFWRSLFVAAAFAVHPVHVESVVWIAERKDVLSGMLFLLTVWSYTRYVRRPDVLRYLPVVILYALGLLAKPMLVTLPFVLLLVDFWPLGRWRPAGAGPVSGSRLLFLLLEKLPLLAMSFASSAITYRAQAGAGALAVYGSRWTTLSNGLVSYSRYLAKAFWPHDLAVFYPFPAHPWPFWAVAGSAGLIGAATLIGFLQLRRRPWVAAGWLWFLGTLVPVIGLVPIGGQSMADRYLYLPLIGLSIPVAWGIAEAGGRWPPTTGVAVLLLVSGLSVAGRVQTGYWRDDLSLYTHSIAVTEDNWLLQNNLGLALERQGRTDEAIARYGESLRLSPLFTKASVNLAAALCARGRLAEAAEVCRGVLARDPANGDVHYNLAIILAGMGMLPEAELHFRDSIRASPDRLDAYAGLGLILYQMGRMDEALATLTRVLARDPKDAEVQHAVGSILESRGDLEGAARHYSEALRLKPDFASARLGLQRVRGTLGAGRPQGK